MNAVAIAMSAVLAAGGVRSAPTQQAAGHRGYERAVSGRLLSQVRIGEDSSRVLALKAVPGVVESVELVRERGRLLWVWDVQVPGKRSITEVSVDVLNGKVVSHEE